MPGISLGLVIACFWFPLPVLRCRGPDQAVGPLRVFEPSCGKAVEQHLSGTETDLIDSPGLIVDGKSDIVLLISDEAIQVRFRAIS